MLIQKFVKKLPFYKEFSFIIIFNAVVIVVLIAMQSFLPPIIPLFYGLPKGQEQLAPRIAITLPSLLSIIVTLINIIIISIQRNEFTNKILLGISIVATLLSTVTIFRIFMLVSSL